MPLCIRGRSFLFLIVLSLNHFVKYIFCFLFLMILNLSGYQRTNYSVNFFFCFSLLHFHTFTLVTAALETRHSLVKNTTYYRTSRTPLTTPLLQYPNTPILQYSNTPIFQYSNIPIFQYSNPQTP